MSDMKGEMKKSQFKKKKLKTDPCCSVSVVVLVRAGGLPGFHGDGRQLGAAFLYGFEEEAEKPGRTNKRTKCENRDDARFSIVNNSHTHTPGFHVVEDLLG